MNEDVINQVKALLFIDAVDPKKSTTVTAICAQVLNNPDFLSQFNVTVSELFNSPNFDIVSELAQLLLALIKLAQNCTYQKTIKIDEMKYILFGCLYTYISNFQQELLKKVDMGVFRLSYSNSWDLISVKPKIVQIAQKTLCDSCLSCFGLSNKIHLSR